jgi:hypothetical protein
MTVDDGSVASLDLVGMVENKNFCSEILSLSRLIFAIFSTNIPSLQITPTDASDIEANIVPWISL